MSRLKKVLPKVSESKPTNEDLSYLVRDFEAIIFQSDLDIQDVLEAVAIIADNTADEWSQLSPEQTQGDKYTGEENSNALKKIALNLRKLSKMNSYVSLHLP